MIITKKAMDRRTLLRGLGAALALPLLDSMVPALSAAGKTAAPVKRFGAIYTPNGIMMRNWTPAAEGASFELPPTLAPLAPFRDRLLVLSGLNSIPPIMPGNEPTGVHARASTRFLSDIQPKPTEGSDLRAGVSVDQMAANQSGQYTQLASLELGLESADSGGAGDPGFSKVYDATIAWRGPTTPLPMEHNPRAVFERLFGDSGNTTPEARLARLKQERSILDSVSQTAAQLERELGPSDRSKLSEYFEAVRDVERRIQKAEEQNTRELPVIEHPAGVPAVYSEHAKLMYDLFVLAYQADLTRVVTFMTGHEFSGQTFPEAGVPDAHHAISHHQNNPASLAKLARIDAFKMSLFAYFLEKLRSTPDGDGSLLDHSMIIYGAGMSDGNAHDPKNLPILLLGGGCGALKSGRHLRYPAATPLANLHIALLDKLGVHVDKIGDSTGELTDL
ncbi:MAG TPA: DUF1552 domain-containing protein [Bryobacteraceae bacterium]|nr:DUF1552 domain-containing protein [Bryobacteraceae bacterium]